jgi:hypothetical protein
MIKNYLPLIHGIIDAYLFLESAGSNELNPDSAVRCTENIAASLLALENADQTTLRSHFDDIAGACVTFVAKACTETAQKIRFSAAPSHLIASEII